MEGMYPKHNQVFSNNLEFSPGAVPLIDLSASRSASPYPRPRSAGRSEDEDTEVEPAAPLRPPTVSESDSRSPKWHQKISNGGLGNFLFRTRRGWQTYIGILVAWVSGCGFGLVAVNRFIFLTGVYKFPYPLTTTLIQIILTHLLLLGSAALTRGLTRPLRSLGLGAAIAPSSFHVGPSSTSDRAGSGRRSGPRWFLSRSGGIAGGGFFEFEGRVAGQVLPLAVIYVAKVLLSNLSFAYAALPVYTLARIPAVPLSIFLTAALMRSSHSVSTLSSTLIAVLNLLMASISPGARVTWESIVAGAFSSVFVALYPIVLLRTFRCLVADLVPQGDLLTGHTSAPGDEAAGTKEETRAYWRTLHYTSILSVMILSPVVVLSGELSNIRRNCYFLDVPFFWFLMGCGAVGGWSLYVSMLLLVKATSPLTATFLTVPRSAFQMVVLPPFGLPVHSWVGVALCWLSSVWFLFVKRGEVSLGGRAAS